MCDRYTALSKKIHATVGCILTMRIMLYAD